MAFLTGSKCKIRFIYIYVRINCKQKNGIKNAWEKVPFEGGRRLMTKAMKNFHFLSSPYRDVLLRKMLSFGSCSYRSFQENVKIWLIRLAQPKYK